MYYEESLNHLSKVLPLELETELVEALHSYHESDNIHVTLTIDENDNLIIGFDITMVDDPDCGYVWQYHNPVYYIELIGTYDLPLY